MATEYTAEDLVTLSEEQRKGFLNIVSKSVGGGGFYNQTQNFFRGIDRFQHNFLPQNVEHVGLTFITRPRLCLRSGALRQRPEFVALDTTRIRDIAFAIRCLLDTRYCREYITESSQSPLLNINNPFFTPICNALQSVSGFPDPIIQTLTTDSGFHSEAQSFATGYDQLSKTYDLTLSFKDIQGGPIAAIFWYWMLYIGYVAKGMMPAYSDDIEAQRMNYTVSIYRFLLDPSRKTITKYAKATGCFPKSVPLGAMFNYSEAEIYNPDSGKFSIPFVANKIEYNKYQILADFNMLVNRYQPTPFDINKSYAGRPMSADQNYQGIPWIDSTDGDLRLVFL